jgi:imidazolonepropionase-like amidohydrolase
VHRCVSAWATCVVFVLLGQAQAVEPPETPRLVAIVGARVIPMTGERVIDDATGLVADGVIRAVGATESIAIPKGARVITARGKFLIPGLGEMHAHVPSGPTPPYSVDDVLFLWAANGVTVARSMLGAPEHLQLRADLAAQRALGPRLLTAGPSLNGSSVKSPEQGAQMVREQKAAGYDFLKLHPGLSRESFLAIAQTAHEVGIQFGGHVSQAVGLQLTLEQGQRAVDHLDGYLLALVPPAAREGRDADDAGLVMKFDPTLLAEVVRMTRAAGTWVVPTETLYENELGPEPVEQLEARPEMRYVPRVLRERYAATKRSIFEDPHMTREFAERYVNTRRQVIRALHDGGVGMLLGSDAPQVYNVPGFAVHRELQVMVASGLTPYQALRTATAAPAEFFGATGAYGTIVAGADADLVLLENDPLQDIANTQSIAGVMVRGRWLDRTYLDRGLREIEKRMAAR